MMTMLAKTLVVLVLLSCLAGRASAAAFAFEPEVEEGTQDPGRCYFVERSGWGFTDGIAVGPDGNPVVLPTAGCLTLEINYLYYNGGEGEDDWDTGYEQRNYVTVAVKTITGCNNETLNQCTISVQDVGDCNKCTQDAETGGVVMSDCSNLGTFPKWQQSLSRGDIDPGDENSTSFNFFTLTSNEDHCAYFMEVQLGPPLSLPPTLSPTVNGSTLPPTDTPTLELVVEASMELGFFEGTKLREPTAQEIEEFLTNTKNFYTEGLELKYRSLESVNLVLVGVTFNQTAPRPLRIDFDLTAVFDPGFDWATGDFPSTERELLESMKSDFDYSDYIQNYVWSTSPTSIFFDTQQAIFKERALGELSQQDILYGNQTNGDCYNIERSIVRHPAGENGCVSHDVVYTYYTGGVDINGVDSGYPRETYAAVEVSFDYGCYDPDNARCVIVDKISGAKCGCQFLSQEFIETPPPTGSALTTFKSRFWTELQMDGCSNFGIFPPMEQKIEFWSGDTVESSLCAFTGEFLRLNADEQRCEHTSPSELPSSIPSSGPSPRPSDSPSVIPSDAPSFIPSSSPSSIPSGAPSLIPSSGPSSSPTESPSAAGGQLSDSPTQVPQEPTVVCSDIWADGAVEDGKCYAVDIFSCVEEWPDGCTRVSTYYEYYNEDKDQPNGGKETYHFVEAKATYGCDPANNPSQLSDGCTITVRGEDCLRCVNDKSRVTMVDCTNHAGIFQPLKNQTIWLLSESGGEFAVKESSAMCNHPSVTMSVDKRADGGSDSTRSVSLDEKTRGLEVLLKLHFTFADGEGSEPNSDALNLVATNTIDFFRTAFLNDPTFADIFVTLALEDVASSYFAGTPDEVDVNMKAIVKIKAASSVKNRQAADVFAKANLNRYVRSYVRHNKSGLRNSFYQVMLVKLKAVAS